MNKSLHPSSITELKRSARSQEHALINDVIERGSEIILGKRHELTLALVCVLARGHLLIEDLPGVGKTTLAHLVAKLLGLNFQRIQFTSDLLPADVVGVSIFDRDTNNFRFHRGPIFTQLLLADEVNRATPRAQSALLEAMEERQVTADGETYALPEPFFVVATQNPSEQIGTFALPESQLDRFLMRISIGYPSREAERELLKGESRRALLGRLKPCLAPDDLLKLQARVDETMVSDALMNYVQDILSYSRETPAFANGLSPRAGLALVQAAKAWALVDSRDHVLPEDVQATLRAVVNHRLDGRGAGTGEGDLVDGLLGAVPIP